MDDITELVKRGFDSTPGPAGFEVQNARSMLATKLFEDPRTKTQKIWLGDPPKPPTAPNVIDLLKIANLERDAKKKDKMLQEKDRLIQQLRQSPTDSTDDRARIEELMVRETELRIALDEKEQRIRELELLHADPADTESDVRRRCNLLTKFILFKFNWLNDGPMTPKELEHHGLTRFGKDWAKKNAGLAKFMAIRDIHHCKHAPPDYPIPPYFKILREMPEEDNAFWGIKPVKKT
jgi:hypothetical protein